MKDIQQICLNGHQITSFVNLHPEEKKIFCPDCGAETITKCPNCQKTIPGGEHGPGSYGTNYYFPASVPDFCEYCGKSFPWKNNKPDSKKSNDITLSDTDSRNVFIVHGHNDVIKNQIELYISQLGFNPIILHKEANLGKTIIEKVEHYGRKSSFAIILFTGDDLGVKYLSPPESNNQFLSKKSMNLENTRKEEYYRRIIHSLKRRARQNVVFEFGYFIGLLGRNNVIMLYEESVELPSDIDGFIHIKLDQDWKNNLEKEIKAISS